MSKYNLKYLQYSYVIHNVFISQLLSIFVSFCGIKNINCACSQFRNVFGVMKNDVSGIVCV
jgi:hypothetical protein